jgi:hypothetical protein
MAMFFARLLVVVDFTDLRQYGQLIKNIMNLLLTPKSNKRRSNMTGYEFTYKSKPEDYTPAAILIGKELGTFYDKQEFGKMNSGFIVSNITGVIMRIISLSDFDEAMNDLEVMAQWCNLRPLAESIAIVCENICKIDPNIVLSKNYINKPLEKWVSDIEEDFGLSLAYIILYGADSTTKRKYLNSKRMEDISKAVAKHGHAGMISLMFRACVACVKLIDKLFIPTYLERRKGMCSKSINTMANAFEKAKHNI